MATDVTSAQSSGRVVVLTGASDGIGKAAARAFAARGDQLIMIGRSESKTAAVANAIMRETGSTSVSWLIADLAEQNAVRALAERLRADHPRIHVLANNAGALFLEHGVTAEGLERTFALNHLSYYTLALSLLPALAAAAQPARPARILNVSSRAHHDATFRGDDLQLARRYRGWKAYANSKLYNILFTRGLAARLHSELTVVHALHPGVASTRFATSNGRMGSVLRRLMDVVAIDVEAAADTLVWLSSCSDAATTNGDYWYKRARRAPSAAALLHENVETLWRQSAQLSGIDIAR